MDFSRALVVVLLMVVCLSYESHGHYNTKRLYTRPGARLYSPSRYRGYHSGYKPNSPSLRTIFRTIYTHYKNKADRDDNRPNTIFGPQYTKPIVIRLPSSVVNDPNFKMSDLPFYLSSGLFDPNNLPGPLGGPSALPRRIVDPINPSGVFGNDDLNDDYNQILGVNNNLLVGGNTNLLAGGNVNPLGGTTGNLLVGTNTNLLGGTNTNLLAGGTNTNLLGGGNTNLLTGGTNTNLLGGGNTNLLTGGTNTKLLTGTNGNLLSGANTLPGAGTNLLGGTGGNILAQG